MKNTCTQLRNVVHILAAQINTERTDICSVHMKCLPECVQLRLCCAFLCIVRRSVESIVHSTPVTHIHNRGQTLVHTLRAFATIEQNVAIRTADDVCVCACHCVDVVQRRVIVSTSS